MRVAVIDLGTNSVRFYAANLRQGKSPQVLLEIKESIRLGESFFGQQVDRWPAYRRTINAFQDFQKHIDELEIERVWAVATSAVRNAQNPFKFVDMIQRRTGIQIEVISGFKEAQLIAKGVISTVELPKTPCLFLDIGGGSTEISYYSKNRVSHSMSLPVGAARCQQTFLETIPPSQDGKSEELLRNEIRKHLHTQSANTDHPDFAQTIGTSGSIRALGRLANGKKKTKKQFTAKFLEDFIHEIRGLTRNELLEISFLEEKRVDLILSAAIILHETLAFYGIDTVQTTKCSLKDGLLTQLEEELFLSPRNPKRVAI